MPSWLMPFGLGVLVGGFVSAVAMWLWMFWKVTIGLWGDRWFRDRKHEMPSDD